MLFIRKKKKGYKYNNWNLNINYYEIEYISVIFVYDLNIDLLLILTGVKLLLFTGNYKSSDTGNRNRTCDGRRIM